MTPAASVKINRIFLLTGKGIRCGDLIFTAYIFWLTKKSVERRKCRGRKKQGTWAETPYHIIAFITQFLDSCH